jgi:hypothetical protein
MKQIFLGMMSLVVMVSCTNEIDLFSYEASEWFNGIASSLE